LNACTAAPASAICLHFEPVGVWARERRFVFKPIINVDPSSKADVAAGIFHNLPLCDIKVPFLTALYQDEPGLAQLRALKAGPATLNKFAKILRWQRPPT
jgi:hypothetical protein